MPPLGYRMWDPATSAKGGSLPVRQAGASGGKASAGAGSSWIMPAEWEPHRATWLAWPKNKTTWPGGLLKKVESVYLQMIKALLPREKVNLLVDDQKTAEQVLSVLSKKRIPAQNLIFHEVKTVDVWIRDYGPVFVKELKNTDRVQKTEDRMRKTEKEIRPLSSVLCPPNTKVAFTKWTFNAWGGKYADLARDNGVVDKIPALENFKRFDPGIILEGGSVDVNGRGAGLTTEQCLLNPNRNAGLSKKEIEKYLKDTFGVVKVIWLKKGIEGDDTDGHVDDIARFVGPHTVLAAIEKNPLDKNHAVLKENLEILRSEFDQAGERLRIVELPMPGKVLDKDGVRLPASYANFYIGNKAVLVPVYRSRNDKLALKIIRSVFPGRKVIGLDCAALVNGLGSVHCVTQQEPA